MILKGQQQDIARIMIECQCGSEVVSFSRYDFKQGKEYFIDILLHAFDTEQESWWSRLTGRIRSAWQILRRGTYRLNELCIERSDLIEFRDALDDFITDEALHINDR